MDIFFKDALILGGGLAAAAAAQALTAAKGNVEAILLSPGASFGASARGPLPGDDPDALYERIRRAGAYQNDPALLRSLCRDWAALRPTAADIFPEREPVARFCARGLRILVREGRVQGALGSDERDRLFAVSTGAVLLAVGGCGDLYAPGGLALRMGDAVGMAYYAGAAMTDLEFVDFSGDRPVSLGGVIVDAEGRATVPGLLAAGGCAAGIHGAGRVPEADALAAWALGRRAGLTLAQMKPLPGADAETLRAWAADTAPLGGADCLTALRALRKEMEEALRQGAGPVRDQNGIESALQAVSRAQHHLNELPPCPEDQWPARLRLENDLIAARLALLSSLERRQSVGAYRRADHPEAAPRPFRVRLALTGTLLYPEKQPWPGE